MTRELELEHKGVTYLVEVEFERTWIDDSFDHDWGGRRQTEECGHWEADADTLEVVSCTDHDGQEIEPDKELMSAIADEVMELDLND